MSKERLGELIQSASARGLLASDATPDYVERPWPIVLMTGIAAWLSAIPLVVGIYLMFGDSLTKGPLIYVLGATFIGATVIFLRSLDPSKFLEQLGLPALLVGGAMLAFGLYRDMPPAAAAAVLTLVIVCVTWLVPYNWLRVLLGALACASFMMIMTDDDGYRSIIPTLGGVYVALIIWLASMMLLDAELTASIRPGDLLALESVSIGWGAMILLVLTTSSGPSFLVGASLDHLRSIGSGSLGLHDTLPNALSMVMAVGGAGWLAYRWPASRAPHILAGAALLVAISCLSSTLGGALAVLAICITSGRWRLALGSAVAATWIAGSFYYDLTLPLSTKAVVIAGLGTTFGLLAWMNWRRPQPAASAPIEVRTDSPWRQAGIAVALAATLICANGAIWQKENLISTGRPIFMALAPVDPRSLMQGDYMALNFDMPALDNAKLNTARRIKVVAKVDARNVAIMQGIDTGKPVAPDEILIELLHTGGGLRPATDAWHFKEGEGERWAKARYGEFRIDGQGRALLVGLRSANLEKL